MAFRMILSIFAPPCFGSTQYITEDGTSPAKGGRVINSVTYSHLIKVPFAAKILDAFVYIKANLDINLNMTLMYEASSDTHNEQNVKIAANTKQFRSNVLQYRSKYVIIIAQH